MHPFTRADWTWHRNGQITFVARHPILSDIAQTLASYDLPEDVTGVAPVTVYVGAHSFTRRVLPRGLKIGLQTEQYLDESGAALWGRATRGRLLRHALQYDMLADLSPANAPAYRVLPPWLRRKLHIGPHIFPDALPPYQPGDGPLAFFGARNPRRDAILADLEREHRVSILPNGLFGAARGEALASAQAVLNLHFEDGIYAEYPRILVAALAGKALVSDPLGAGLVQGQHYLGPGDPLTPAGLRQAHANMVRDLTQKARFSDLMRAFWRRIGR